MKEQNAKANEMEDRADRQLAEANARAEERERLKEERLREIRQETQEYWEAPGIEPGSLAYELW